MRLSVIMPAREEPVLQRTVDDVLAQARGDVEVIVVLDGYWPNPALKTDPRVKTIHWAQSRGLRPAINAAMRIATGTHLLKLDAHCSVSEGFDVELFRGVPEDAIVVPAKYSLDLVEWRRYRQPWQYFWLTYPWDLAINPPGLHDKAFGVEQNRARATIDLDPILTYQGSCWGLSRPHWDRIGPMEDWYYYAQEPQELGLRTWLRGGQCLINKRVWYAHLWKGHGRKRGFRRARKAWHQAVLNSATYWLGDQDPQATRPFRWLVERFWPLLHDAPVGPWPEDWDNPECRVLALEAYEAAMRAEKETEDV